MMRDMCLTSRTGGYGWDDIWIVLGSQKGFYDRGMPEHCTAQFRRAPCYEPMVLSPKEPGSLNFMAFPNLDGDYSRGFFFVP